MKTYSKQEIRFGQNRQLTFLPFHAEEGGMVEEGRGIAMPRVYVCCWEEWNVVNTVADPMFAIRSITLYIVCKSKCGYQ